MTPKYMRRELRRIAAIENADDRNRQALLFLSNAAPSDRRLRRAMLNSGANLSRLPFSIPTPKTPYIRHG